MFEFGVFLASESAYHTVASGHRKQEPSLVALEASCEGAVGSCDACRSGCCGFGRFRRSGGCRCFRFGSGFAGRFCITGFALRFLFAAFGLALLFLPPALFFGYQFVKFAVEGAGFAFFLFKKSFERRSFAAELAHELVGFLALCLKLPL